MLRDPDAYSRPKSKTTLTQNQANQLKPATGELSEKKGGKEAGKLKIVQHEYDLRRVKGGYT